MLQELTSQCFTKHQTRQNPGVSRKELLKRRKLAIESPEGQHLKKEIERLYSEGFGLKRLARDYLGITYTCTRMLMHEFGIEYSKGHSVVTDSLRKFRKQKAINEKNTLTGWANPEIRRKIELTNMRGVQGYYFNKSLNKYVWLRSTYEYIFAKWLDKTNHIWDIECKVYTLPGNIIYRPDFFILDEEHKYTKIVEIKGYWDSNSHRAKLLNETLDIPVSIIHGNEGISRFIESGSDYYKQLELWKKVKLSGEDIKNHDRKE